MGGKRKVKSSKRSYEEEDEEDPSLINNNNKNNNNNDSDDRRQNPDDNVNDMNMDGLKNSNVNNNNVNNNNNDAGGDDSNMRCVLVKTQSQMSSFEDEVETLIEQAGFNDETRWNRLFGGRFFRPSIISFTIACCILATINGALTAGYVSSVITTIEKRFQIGSSYSGLIAASVEIGGASSAVFVSYFGSARHIPGWIGLGALMTGFGALGFTMPHLLAPAYTASGKVNSSSILGSMCSPKNIPDHPYPQAQINNLPAIGESQYSPTYLSKLNEEACIDDSTGPSLYVLILVLSQILIGVGGSPLYTLGTTYIDNHVSRTKAPTFIAFIYACGVFGPIFGFALGALMLQYYVDLTFDFTTLNLSPSHPNWVGAWWCGFVLIGSLLLIVSTFFYSFPKVLVNELKLLAKQDKEKFFSLMDSVTNTGLSKRPTTSSFKKIQKNDLKKQHSLQSPSQTPSKSLASVEKAKPCQEDLVHNDVDDDDDDVNYDTGTYRSTYGKKLKDIPQAMCKILKNPIFLVTSLGICCEVSVVSGFVFFLPKYLERQFGKTKSAASLLTGVVAIPGSVIGILVGGHCLRQCQLTSRGAIKLVLVLNFIALLLCVSFFPMGCNNVKIAGLTVPYNNYSHYNNLNQYVNIDQYSLSSKCNQHCHCNHNTLNLVCGQNNVVFFSPCHAGCTRVISSLYSEQNYTDCACVQEDSGEVNDVSFNYNDLNDNFKKGGWVSSIREGSCQHNCNYLVFFMIVLFILTFIVTATQMPLLMITIRSVGEQEKALALGLQFVMLRVFAYIPAPLVYGAYIDSTCTYWTKVCGVLTGTCLHFDLVNLRYKFVGLSFVYKLLAVVFYVLDWFIMFLQREKDCGGKESPNRISLVVVDDQMANSKAVVPMALNQTSQSKKLIENVVFQHKSTLALEDNFKKTQNEKEFLKTPLSSSQPLPPSSSILASKNNLEVFLNPEFSRFKNKNKNVNEMQKLNNTNSKLKNFSIGNLVQNKKTMNNSNETNEHNANFTGNTNNSVTNEPCSHDPKYSSFAMIDDDNDDVRAIDRR